MTDRRSSGDWWGVFHIPKGATGRWCIGPRNLWLQRLEGEWRIGQEEDPQAQEDRLSVTVPLPMEEASGFPIWQRFALSAGETRIRILPILADRPVVTRPEMPFTLLGRERITLYVSTPLWVQLGAGEPESRMAELPLVRPSDTWFGSSTMDGELCYASRTFARLRVEDLQFHPHRATTALTLVNQAAEPLPVERFKLPVEFLALFRDRDGHLWTEDVRLRREDGDPAGYLRMPDRWKRIRDGAERISPARSESPRNPVIRAFSSLFG